MVLQVTQPLWDVSISFCIIIRVQALTEVRNSVKHRQHADLYASALTVGHQPECLKNHGVRYSVLLQLPYFDIVRCHIIDPMHNLLLGTAKHVMKHVQW